MPTTISHVKIGYLKTDMCKFESLHKDGSRAQSADTSKAFIKARASSCLLQLRKLATLLRANVEPAAV